MEARKKFLILLAPRNLIRRKQQQTKQKIIRLILICYKRKKLQKLISTSYLVSLKGIKTYCSMNRNDTWFTELWENRNCENFRESFKEDSRIYPNTVVDIVNLVEGNISKQDTKYRNAIHVENRVSIVLWWLAIGLNRSTGKTFSVAKCVAKSTAVSIAHDFREELLSYVANFIKFRLSIKVSAKAISKFKEYCKCKIPQTVDGIDGTHIGIKAAEMIVKLINFVVSSRTVWTHKLLFGKIWWV